MPIEEIKRILGNAYEEKMMEYRLEPELNARQKDIATGINYSLNILTDYLKEHEGESEYERGYRAGNEAGYDEGYRNAEFDYDVSVDEWRIIK